MLPADRRVRYDGGRDDVEIESRAASVSDMSESDCADKGVLRRYDYEKHCRGSHDPNSDLDLGTTFDLSGLAGIVFARSQTSISATAM